MNFLMAILALEHKIYKFGMYSRKKFVVRHFLYYIRNQNQHDKIIRSKSGQKFQWLLQLLVWTNFHLQRQNFIVFWSGKSRPDSHLGSQTLTSHLSPLTSHLALRTSHLSPLPLTSASDLWPGAYFNSRDRDSETEETRFCQ